MNNRRIAAKRSAVAPVSDKVARLNLWRIEWDVISLMYLPTTAVRCRVLGLAAEDIPRLNLRCGT